MGLILKHRSVLPGFHITLGYTVFYLSLIVLIPLAAMLLKVTSMSWGNFIDTVTHPRVIEAFKLSFGAALVAAAINTVFGTVLAWILVRYDFPGKRMIDGMVDLPFALPTAVSGIALTTIYSRNGWMGSWLEEWGIKVAFSSIGITIALVFIGLPFVVRSLQPSLEDLDAEVEEAAASLGASRWQTITRVILPTVLPALLSGFSLAFARAVGEYGSVVFISGNMPYKTEIIPLLIISKFEQYDYNGAAAIAFIMLVVSFVLLLTINLLQSWSSRWSRSPS